MEYKYITEYDSPNFGYPTGTRGQNEPKQIVIHHWGSDDSTFSGTVSWLCNPKSQVSAHFVVEAGRSACLVNWNDAGWHAGNKNVNMSSIGIECHPRCSYADMVEVAKVIALLWKEYGKLPLVGHKDIVATACPGRWYDKLDKLTEMAEVIYNGGELPATEEPKKQIVLGEYDTLREADDVLGDIYATISSLETALDDAKTYAGKLEAALKNVKVVG